MTPDDVARLFPLEAGLFDYCIFDESSQIDLPSAVPVLFRSKRAIIAGDPKQMKAMRFSYSNNQVAAQASCLMNTFVVCQAL
jgi:superfamily I DNA and/or RNA helicase